MRKQTENGIVTALCVPAATDYICQVNHIVSTLSGSEDPTWGFEEMALRMLVSLRNIVVFLLLSRVEIATGFSIPRPLNITLGDISEQCTDSNDWLAAGFLSNDFIKAVDEIWADAVPRHSQLYEFLPNFVKPAFKLPIIRTPRKYTVGELLRRTLRAIFVDGEEVLVSLRLLC